MYGRGDSNNYDYGGPTQYDQRSSDPYGRDNQGMAHRLQHSLGQAVANLPSEVAPSMVWQPRHDEEGDDLEEEYYQAPVSSLKQVFQKPPEPQPVIQRRPGKKFTPTEGFGPTPMFGVTYGTPTKSPTSTSWKKPSPSPCFPKQQEVGWTPSWRNPQHQAAPPQPSYGQQYHPAPISPPPAPQYQAAPQSPQYQAAPQSPQYQSQHHPTPSQHQPPQFNRAPQNQRRQQASARPSSGQFGAPLSPQRTQYGAVGEVEVPEPAWRDSLRKSGNINLFEDDPHRLPTQQSQSPPQHSPKHVAFQQDGQPGYVPVHQPRVQDLSKPGEAGPGSEDAQVVHMQYNSPLNLYSKQNAQETLDGQTQGQPGQGSLQVTGAGRPGAYSPNASPTYRLIQEEENRVHPRGYGLKQSQQEQQPQSYDTYPQSRSMQALEQNMSAQADYGSSDF